MIREIINLILFPNTCDNDHFINYLRKNGAVIGEKTRFIDPKRCSIDPGRLDYIEIGNNCCISVASLIAHDYSWYILKDAFNDILPDSGGKITIGNNCFIGYQAVILKGTSIGDNVIVGARSVVKGKFPSNCVIAGVPAKIICSLEDYYKKLSNNRISDAIYRRDHIINKYRRYPTIEEMGFFSFLFLERNEDNYKKYIHNLEFNGIKGSPDIRDHFFATKPVFNSFDEFLKC